MSFSSLFPDISDRIRELLGGLTDEIIEPEGHPLLPFTSTGLNLAGGRTTNAYATQLGDGLRFMQAAKSVGVLQYKRPYFQSKYSDFGTAWLVSTNVLATNRHVLPGMYLTQEGPVGINVRINFSGAPSIQKTARIREVIYLRPDGPDLALLGLDETPPETPPLPLALDVQKNQVIYVVGFPNIPRSHILIQSGEHLSRFPRNKHLSPGLVMEKSPQGDTFTHKASTLKGNSGSPVLNDSAQVVGVHTKGLVEVRNRAVSSQELVKILDHLEIPYTSAQEPPPI